MDSIARQLGLDYTYFIQLAVFIAFYILISRTYLVPFQRLFTLRHQRTIEDKLIAERLAAEAADKRRQYEESRLDALRQASQAYEATLQQAKAREAEILANARDEAKKIIQGALAEVTEQRQRLAHELSEEANKIAKTVSEILLRRS